MGAWQPSFDVCCLHEGQGAKAQEGVWLKGVSEGVSEATGIREAGGQVTVEACFQTGGCVLRGVEQVEPGWQEHKFHRLG